MFGMVFLLLPVLVCAQTVEIKTSKGTITVELYADKAPNTVKNFLEYVEAGFYSNTIFHRVMKGYLVQGGMYGKNLEEKVTRPPIKSEEGNGLSNVRATIAMSRTNEIDSATSQFFFNVVDNKTLDSYGGGYTVFGKVTHGFNVVHNISQMRVSGKKIKGQSYMPVFTVFIYSISIKKE